MPNPDQLNRPDRTHPNRDPGANATTDAAGRQGTVRPATPGGGALSNSLFSGDHVLETIAKGNGTLRRGARGPAVRAIQQYLIASGYNLGRSGADGAWRSMVWHRHNDDYSQCS